MSKLVSYELYVRIEGEVEAESEDKWDVLNAIFPDGWDGEVSEVYVETPRFASDGHIKVIREEVGEDV